MCNSAVMRIFYYITGNGVLAPGFIIRRYCCSRIPYFFIFSYKVE